MIEINKGVFCALTLELVNAYTIFLLIGILIGIAIGYYYGKNKVMEIEQSIKREEKI